MRRRTAVTVRGHRHLMESRGAAPTRFPRHGRPTVTAVTAVTVTAAGYSGDNGMAVTGENNTSVAEMRDGRRDGL